MSAVDNLTREQLLTLCKNFAKNWLAHDGLWFQAVEHSQNMERAIELDAEAWSRFSPIEAKRIKQFLGLPENGGLEALQEALEYRLYAVLNKQHSEMLEGKLRFYMNDCRVQSARKRKGLPDFPCKPVGLVEYETFAHTIDSRIRTRCITCPPDEHPEEYYCAWEFWIDETTGEDR
ncbi:MAG: hypothetical protein GY854_04215 [Deltaproteobacteria bacterium]|nr:hypothetical protein [Deltaproteobacteria bacterium]